MFANREAFLLQALIIMAPEPLKAAESSLISGNTLIFGSRILAEHESLFQPAFQIWGEKIRRLVLRTAEINTVYAWHHGGFVEALQSSADQIKKNITAIDDEIRSLENDFNKIQSEIGRSDTERALGEALENLLNAKIELVRNRPDYAIEAAKKRIWMQGAKNTFVSALVEETAKKAFAKLRPRHPSRFLVFLWESPEMNGERAFRVIVVGSVNMELSGPTNNLVSQ